MESNGRPSVGNGLAAGVLIWIASMRSSMGFAYALAALFLTAFLCAGGSVSVEELDRLDETLDCLRHELCLGNHDRTKVDPGCSKLGFHFGQQGCRQFTTTPTFTNSPVSG